MKKGIGKEVKIGIAFIIAIFILYFGISFLKGVNIFKPANSYQVEFDDVTSLTVSSPVLLNGYAIGLVNSMELDPENNKIIVTLNLNKGVKIPVGSEFKVDTSLLGSANVLMIPAANTGEFYTSEDMIKGSEMVGMMDAVAGALPQVVNLLPKIDSILMSVQVLVSNPALTGSLENMNAITGSLKQSSVQLNQLMLVLNKDVPTITSNFADASQNLSTQINSLDLSKSMSSIESTLNNVELLTKKLNSNDNSVGLLLNDRQLYDSLTTTLGNAAILLKDVKDNPSRYINVKVF